MCEKEVKGQGGGPGAMREQKQMEGSWCVRRRVKGQGGGPGAMGGEADGGELSWMSLCMGL